MRRVFLIAGAATIAIFALAQGNGKELLGGFTKSLNSADRLSVNYTILHVGQGAATPYTVDLKKPNLARLNTPNQLVVADGKTITSYDKKAKTYFKQPQTDQLLAEALSSDELNVWSSFFNPNALAKVASVKSLGTKNRKGMTLNAVETTMDSAGRKVVTLYLDDKKMARQAEILLNDVAGKFTTILDAKSLTVGSDVDTASDAALFAFAAPDGSREMTMAEMNSAKWYENLEEAEQMAAKTNRLVMVDFYTDWCHWCKVLDAEVYPAEEFKQMSKYYVFCRIDAEKQADVAKPFNITGYPDIRFLKADGSEVGHIIGYKPLKEFLADMEKFRG